MKLCSACLLGINCSYDGGNRANEYLMLYKDDIIIPICPEIYGGLPTPREPAEQRGDRVYTKSGKDITGHFMKGAREVLKIAKLYDIKEAILKSRSPSCGCGKIYDGTFSRRLIDGDGVTTALLKQHGIRVITEEDLSGFL
jgi:uncharacterized protein YbbK (DUF523 family)